MVDLILRTLFDFSDQLHDEAEKMRKQKKESLALKAELKRKTVQDCIRLVHDSFRISEEAKIPVKNAKPKNEAEKMIFMIPAIEIYSDAKDGSRYYELDNVHFDTPDEVFRYVITVRSLKAAATEFSRSCMEILRRLDNIINRKENAVKQRKNKKEDGDGENTTE